MARWASQKSPRYRYEWDAAFQAYLNTYPFCMDCKDYQVVAPAYDLTPGYTALWNEWRNHWVCLNCGDAWWVL